MPAARTFVVFLIAGASSGAVALAQQTIVGKARWSADGYTEYLVGNAPIVVTAGHGGDLEPPSLPDRTWGTTVKDTRTLELARELAASLRQRFGLHPHVVLFHLSRRKVDVNRDIVEAAQGDPGAEQAYLAFHAACAEARSRVLSNWGYGFYVDLHGHGHPEGWVELGYALTSSQLALPDATLAQPAYVAQSTLRSAGSGVGVWFPELLRGNGSLGAFLEGGGYASVPSPSNPDPAGGNYFNGGFNVREYGSLDGTPVDGVQIETPWSVRSTTMVRAPFLSRVGGWMEQFFAAYRGAAPSQGGRVTVSAADRIASETGGGGEIVVTRSGSLAQSRLVTLTWTGSATRGVDYVATPLVAFFAAGVAEVRIPIDPVDDTFAEGDETVEVWLSAGNDIGVQNRAQVVLRDDEPHADLALAFGFESIVAGAVLDGSGNGRDGQLVGGGGGPALVSGARGNALGFDGNDDRVRVADFAYAPSGGFSLAFWFRTSEPAGSGFAYLLSHGGVSANRLSVYLDRSNGHLRTGLIYANDLTDLDVLDVSRDLRDGQWHHYALVATTDELVQVFLDGEPVTAAVYRGDVLDPAGDFVLGARADLAASTFGEVELDELTLWNRPLADVEVELLHAPPVGDGMVYPGSGEDLQLATGVDAPPTAGVGFDVKVAASGSLLIANYRSPGGTFQGGIAGLAGEVFVTGAPPVVPGLPSVHLSTLVLAHGPIVLGAGGGTWVVTIPPGLSGSSLMLQPFVVFHPAAQNGLFAIGDGHEIRF